MLHGILPVYKPKGYTSHDIVRRIRQIVGQKRVGHTGTLDPEVEGVLPICLGQATRVAEYIQDRPKRYRGTMKLGIATDTEDQTGEIIQQTEVSSLLEEQVQSVFQSFLGEIAQIPPMYSAVKYKGKRLYEWARQGQMIKRKPRKVTIYSIRCLGIEQGSYPTLAFDVTCSKGTYIRTLCVDIGKKLGYPAHLSSLIRTKSGPFYLEDCYQLEQLLALQRRDELKNRLYSIDEVLGHFPSVIVYDEDVRYVENGLPIKVENSFSIPLLRIYSESGKFCALYRFEEGIAKPEKVFRDVTD